MTSHNNILPDDVITELIIIRETGTRLSWRVGDLTSMAIEYGRASEQVVSVMEIYGAVADFVGYASRTVRDMHTVSAFYPADIRQKYEQHGLSFAHFRAAMALGPDWDEALNWAVEQIDVMGKPCSVDAMIAKYMAAPIDIELNAGAEDDDDNPANEGEGDSPGNQIRAAVLAIRRNVGKLDLDNGMVEQVEEALAVLEELLISV